VKQFSDQLGLGFDFAPTAVTVDNVMAPTGYTGLSAFHKYWGKKPIECLGYLIEKLTTDDDVVLDPFVGSGLIAPGWTAEFPKLKEKRDVPDVLPTLAEIVNEVSLVFRNC